MKLNNKPTLFSVATFLIKWAQNYVSHEQIYLKFSSHQNWGKLPTTYMSDQASKKLNKTIFKKLSGSINYETAFYLFKKRW